MTVQIDALTCLRDVVPEALEIVVQLANPRQHDDRMPSACGDWAWCVSDRGLWTQRAEEWWQQDNAWGKRPKHLLPWADLAELIEADPRRAEVTAWAGTLTFPCWRELSRPKEIGARPGEWHISYLCRDHVDDAWPGRRRAWQLVLDILSERIDRLHASELLAQPEVQPWEQLGLFDVGAAR